MKIYDDKNKLLAIIIQNKDIEKEKNFVTDNEQEMQLASFNLKEATKIICGSARSMGIEVKE